MDKVKMEFAKYYDCGEVFKKLLEEKKLECYEGNHGYVGHYVCSDTHDFWVCRILKGYDYAYNISEDSFLVERNKIDKYEFVDFYCEKYGYGDNEGMNRNYRDMFIDCLDVRDIVSHVLIIDDESGLEGWDAHECSSLEECVKVIDGGFGILTLPEGEYKKEDESNELLEEDNK